RRVENVNSGDYRNCGEATDELPLLFIYLTKKGWQVE
ncbi:MAG: hypothetical protein UT62_C0016G0004, partial [Parcubacteria group bacterium GW2011_GWC1_39_8]